MSFLACSKEKSTHIAKREKNYSKADEIRNFLKEKGIELIDQSTEITKWIRI